MIELDPSRFKTKPFKHQLAGVKALVKYPTFAILDEMRLGKTKQAIDAACALHEANEVGLVLVIAPAGVRTVWTNPDPAVGEIAKHAWRPSWVSEFHAKGMRTVAAANGQPPLIWWVTNYEFIRNPDHEQELARLLRAHRLLKKMMVLDESSFIKTPRAAQTRACLRLGKLVDRRVILNGTPVTRGPMDLYSQFGFLSPRILGFQNFYAYRWRYAVMGGWQHKQIVGYQNLDELSALVAPYCLRRRLEDCFDLPADLPPTYREVPLSEAAWRHYKTVREEMVAWLKGAAPTVVASTAAVRALRLAQVCGGFLGGVDEDETGHARTVAVDDEKFKATMEMLDELRGEERPVIVWCRFRAERERLYDELTSGVSSLSLGGKPTYQIYGGQPPRDRAAALLAFGHNAEPGFRVMLAQPAAGGLGLDLSLATSVIYHSRDFSAFAYWQSKLRVKHALKTLPVGYTYLIATGPKGQKTADHLIDKVLRAREEVATWTSARWRQELEEE